MLIRSGTCTGGRLMAIALFLACLVTACGQPWGEGNVRAGREMAPFTAGPPTSAKYDTPARFVSGDAPVYPATKLRNAVNGSCVIRFTITEEGTTGDFVVVRSDDEYFAGHAVLAMKKWRFQPARKDGKPVAVTFEYTVDFTVNR